MFFCCEWGSHTATLALLILLWYVSCTYLLATIKIISNDYQYPAMLTLWLNAESTLVLIGYNISKEPVAPKVDQGNGRRMSSAVDMKLIVIGAIQGLELILGTEALYILPLSLKAMLHVLLPFFTMMFSVCMGVEKLTLQTTVAVVTIAVGAMLCVDGYVDVSLIGLGFQLVSCLIASVRWVLVQDMLSKYGRERPEAMLIPANIACCVVVGICVTTKLAVFDGGPGPLVISPSVMKMMLAAGVGVALVQVIEWKIVRMTSGLTLAVIAALHNFCPIVFAMIYFHEQCTVYNVTGALLSQLGVLLYSIRTQEEKPAACSLDEQLPLTNKEKTHDVKAA